MESYTFSDFTLARLYAAGWHENRCRATEGYQSNLEGFGYPFHACAREFLSSFGDLQIYYPYPASPSEMNGCLFDPIQAARNQFLENIQLDAEIVGSPLCVIGECDGGHATLTIAEDGRVFLHEGLLACVALSGPKAIDVLVQGTELHTYFR